MALPEKGSFKIQTIGPKKDIPKKDKPNEHWTSYSLQFEGDPNWYDTFWTKDEAPAIGDELTGEKDEHEKFGFQFKMDRPGGRGTYNPAAAQATVVSASVAAVNGFLALGDNYEKYLAKDPVIATRFEQYMATVKRTADNLKDMTTGLGSISQEKQTSSSESSASAPAADSTVRIAGMDEDETAVDL